MIDALTALRLQLEWGADEALEDAAVDRFAPPRPAERSRAAGPSVAQPRLAGRPVSQAGTLEALYAEIDAFEGSPLRATATHTVRPPATRRRGWSSLVTRPAAMTIAPAGLSPAHPGSSWIPRSRQHRPGPAGHAAHHAGSLAAAREPSPVRGRNPALSAVCSSAACARAAPPPRAAWRGAGPNVDGAGRSAASFTRTLARRANT